MRLNIISILCFCSLTLLSQSTSWIAPLSFSSQKNPITYSDESVKTGKFLYQKFCSACHGKNGKGDGPAAIALFPRPVDYTSEKFQKETDGSIFWKIAEGKGSMPSWKKTLSSEQRWKLVHFIRSLNPQPLPVIVSDRIKNIPETIITVKTPAVQSDSAEIMSQIEKKIEFLTLVFQKQIDSLKIQNENMVAESEKEKSGKNKFLATGSANALTILNTEDLNEFGFGTGFFPLFLWKPSDKLFFESHFHIEGEAGTVSNHSHSASITDSKFAEASISISNMNLSYFLNGYLTVSAGYFPSPFGLYNERMHADWINKLPDAPLGTGHGSSVSPSTELGVQLRGGTKIGKSHINYSLYSSNGPQLLYTTEDAGKLLFGSVADNNGNKAIGGRLGILPFRRSTFELGFSAQYAKTGDRGSAYKDLGVRMYATDLSFKANSKALKGTFGFISQFTYLDIDNANYTVIFSDQNARTRHESGDTIIYYFVNTSYTGFAQVSFRPTISKNNVIKNIELVLRFDEITLPKNALWTMNDKRWAVGIDYWIEPRSMVKLCYEIGQYRNLAMIQFVIGF